MPQESRAHIRTVLVIEAFFICTYPFCSFYSSIRFRLFCK